MNTDTDHTRARALANRAEAAMNPEERAEYKRAGAARKAAMRRANAADYRSMLARVGAELERRP